MATKDTTTDNGIGIGNGAEDGKVTSKEVTIRAYISENYDGDKRQMVADVLPVPYADKATARRTYTSREYSVNWFGKTLTEDDSYHVDDVATLLDEDIDLPFRLEEVVDADDIHGVSETALASISDHLEARAPPISRTVEETEEETYKKSDHNLDNLTATMLKELTHGYGVFEAGGYGEVLRSTRDDSDAVVTIGTDIQSNVAVLKHHTGRSSDDRYVEEDGQRKVMPWAIDITVSVDGVSSEEEAVDADEYIESVYRAVESLPAVSLIRVTSCEVTKSGDCYDV